MAGKTNSMQQQYRFKCIIFDCDNVLVDTETIFVSVLMDMAGSYGVEMEADEALRVFAGRKIGDTIKVLENLCGKPFPETFETAFRAKLYDEFRLGVSPVEGVEQLLSSLKLPYCVASSGPREKIELNLKLTGLEHFFTANKIFSCYEINSWKPEPSIFLHAAAAMGYAPKDCAVIEDSIAGIQAGISGGFTVFGLSNGFNDEELAAEGAIVFHYMDELPQLLGLDMQ